MKPSPKTLKITYLSGVIVSLSFGIWHFFTPMIYDWTSYIDNTYISLKQSILWINFLFSLFLTGHSLILLRFHHELFHPSTNHLFEWLNVMFLCIWLGRVGITIIFPFTGHYDYLFWIMECIFLLITLLIGIPILYHLRLKNGSP